MIVETSADVTIFGILEGNVRNGPLPGYWEGGSNLPDYERRRGRRPVGVPSQALILAALPIPPQLHFGLGLRVIGILERPSERVGTAIARCVRRVH
jgi:hypothetical protein